MSHLNAFPTSVLTNNIIRWASFSNSPSVLIEKCHICCITGPNPSKVGISGLLYFLGNYTFFIHSGYGFPLMGWYPSTSAIILCTSACTSAFDTTTFTSKFCDPLPRSSHCRVKKGSTFCSGTLSLATSLSDLADSFSRFFFSAAFSSFS